MAPRYGRERLIRISFGIFQASCIPDHAQSTTVLVWDHAQSTTEKSMNSSY